MDKNNIENLVEKYFDGLTSLEEEKVLKKLFQKGETLPTELEIYRSFFNELDQAKSISAPIELEQNVLNLIKKKPEVKVRRLFPLLMKIASVFVIGFSLYFLITDDNGKHNQSVAMMEDTYDTPEAAFAAYKAAMATVSRRIKKGEDKVKNEISHVKVLTSVIK